MNHRNGKIARLPKDVRQLVCQMLEDGATYDAIIESLKELGYEGFNRVNINHWRQGGYRDWQADQLLDIREKNGDPIGNQQHANTYGLLAMQLATRQLYRVVYDFDPDVLRRRLAQKPEHYFNLMRAFSRVYKNKSAFEGAVKSDAFDKVWAKRTARPKPEPQNAQGESPDETDDATDQDNGNDAADEETAA
jgi:hypothetical protein